MTTETATETAVPETAPAPVVVTVYSQLLDAARGQAGWVERKPDELVAPYLQRLVLCVKEVPDDVWNKLDEQTTQAWFNSAATILNAGEPLTTCPGLDDAKPAKAAKAPKAPKPPKAEKPAKAPKAPKEPKEKLAPADGHSSRGIIGVLREAVILNPGITTEEMKKVADENGFIEPKASTISTIRTDTLSTINIAKRLGLWGGVDIVKAADAATA